LATFSKLPSGSWRAQVRRKGRYIGETFLKREDAQRWATAAESAIDHGETAPHADPLSVLFLYGDIPKTD
jgi:hypothetical protein